MEVLIETYYSQRDKLPKGRRYERPAYVVAAALMTTLDNDVLYSKVLKTLGLLLPGVSQVNAFLADKLGPELDGFSLQHLSKVRGYFCAMISELLGVTLDKAAEVLDAHPEVFLSDDATSVRQQLGFAPRAEQVIGLTHKKSTYRVCSPEEIAGLLNDEDVSLADNADTFLLRLAQFPTIPPFLLAVVPTFHGEKGTQTVPVRSKLFLDLAKFINSVMGLRLLGHGCDGAGQPMQRFLSLYPGEKKYRLPPLPDLGTEAAKALLAASFARGEARDLSELPLQQLSVLEVDSVPFLLFQDAPHQLVRLFGSLKKDGFQLGQRRFTFDMFEPLLARLPPNWLAATGLRLSDFLDPIVDRMNVARPERVLLNFSAPSVLAEFTSLVQPNPVELDALKDFQYLAETVRYAILPFLDPELAVLDRLSMLWRARSRILLMELDRDLRISAGNAAADSPGFTSACRTGIKQNAESFYAQVLYVIRTGRQEIFEFYPWLALSQACEDLFRMLRFLGFSDRGMSVQELLQRYNRLVPMQILGLAQRPAQPKRCKRFDSSTKGGWIPPSLLSRLDKDTNEAAIVELLTFAMEEEVQQFVPFSSQLAPKASGPAARMCVTGHTLTANVSYLPCETCQRIICNPCAQLPKSLWDQYKAAVLQWTCPRCVSQTPPASSSPPQGQDVDGELGEVLESDEEQSNVLKMRKTYPDLQKIARSILTSSVREDARMHDALLRLGRAQQVDTNLDAESLVHQLFPNLLWTVTKFGPRRQRSVNTNQQAIFGGQSVYLPMQKYLGHLTPKQRESADRTARVIHRKRPQDAAGGPAGKRQQLDQGDSEVVPLSCCGRLSSTEGLRLIGCDGCQGWFCYPCLSITRTPKTQTWFCSQCKNGKDK